jgi:peptidoglycan hydrolase CwlO-like protein
MSKETERIVALETNQNNIMKEISEIKWDVKTILEKIDCLDRKFAPKRVESAMKVFLGTLCLAVIWAIIKLVLIS